MRRLDVKIRQLIWAIREAKKPQPYDKVQYGLGEYYIKSSFTGYNKWNLYPIGGDEVIHCNIKGENLIVINYYGRFIRTVLSKLKFQKQTWQRIDLQNPVGTRLSYINSDSVMIRD